MKLSKLAGCFALAGLFAFSHGAMAQARTGFYAFGGIGSADHSVDTNTFNTTYALGAPGVDTAGVSQSRTAYKLGAGYRFGRYFAAEVAYAQLGKTTYNLTRTAGIFSGTFRFNAKPEAWQIAAVGIFPISNSFEVFGKLGAAFTDNDGDMSTSGFPPVAQAGSASSDTVAVAGIGLNFNWGPNFFLRGEYEQYSKYKLATVPDLRPVFGPLAQPGGDIKNKTSVWSLGVGYRF